MLPPIKTSLRFIELSTLNSSKNEKILSKVKLQPKFHTISPKATKSKYFDKSRSASPKASRKTDIHSIKQKSESKFSKRINVISIEKNWHKLSFNQIDTIKTLLAPYYSTRDLTLMLLGLENQSCK